MGTLMERLQRNVSSMPGMNRNMIKEKWQSLCQLYMDKHQASQLGIITCQRSSLIKWDLHLCLMIMAYYSSHQRILVNVDSIIIVDKDPHKYMYTLMQNFTVNNASIGETNLYLVTDIIKVNYNEDSYSCTMSSDYYVKEDIMNVENVSKMRRWN